MSCLKTLVKQIHRSCICQERPHNISSFDCTKTSFEICNSAESLLKPSSTCWNTCFFYCRQDDVLCLSNFCLMRFQAATVAVFSFHWDIFCVSSSHTLSTQTLRCRSPAVKENVFLEHKGLENLQCNFLILQFTETTEVDLKWLWVKAKKFYWPYLSCMSGDLPCDFQEVFVL